MSNDTFSHSTLFITHEINLLKCDQNIKNKNPNHTGLTLPRGGSKQLKKSQGGVWRGSVKARDVLGAQDKGRGAGSSGHYPPLL